MKRAVAILAASLTVVALLTGCRPAATARATTPMDRVAVVGPGQAGALDTLYWQASVLPADVLRRAPGR